MRAHGDEVEQYAVHNDAIENASRLEVALETIWNPNSYRLIGQSIARFRPDVLHSHNIFPIASPSVYYAARKARVPVVQTVANYRLLCPAATFLREGRICEDCLGHLVPFPGVIHACYRNSRLASATVASMLTVHRMAETWRNNIAQYIAVTGFLKSKLVEGGLPAEKISVKPNFLAHDPGSGPGHGAYVLFAGRLAPEKGLQTLLAAWRSIPGTPLKIAGDGPLRERIAGLAAELPNVSLLGYKSGAQILELMKQAALLVVPSEWYEGFPLTIVEAMGCGTPVVASDLGSLREIVEEDITGARFAPGDSARLSTVIRQLLDDPKQLATMRGHARARFLERYSAEVNYRQLQAIYSAAIAQS